MTQMKKSQASSGKKDYSVTTAREMPKAKGKNPDKTCQDF